MVIYNSMTKLYPSRMILFGKIGSFDRLRNIFVKVSRIKCWRSANVSVLFRYVLIVFVFIFFIGDLYSLVDVN